MRITTAIPLLALAATFYQAPSPSPLPPRDAPARSDSGRSSLVGRVVLVMDGGPLPIRRAHVALASDVLTRPEDTDTDIEGRYHFDALPAGHYRVVVEKPGFVARDGGASVSDRAPTIDLQRDASAVLDVVMQRGAAVEGRIVNASGEPAANVTVMAFARVEVSAARRGQSATLRPTISVASVCTPSRLASTDRFGIGLPE
jgi:hypothetical protein